MTSAEIVSERDTPSGFNVSYDDDHVPQRELTDFTVTCGDEKISICSLDDSSKQSAGHVIARGNVLRKVDDGSMKGKVESLRIVSAPLSEWCIEYDQVPKLWVRSADVWYRLDKPSKEYAKTHEMARRRFELCSRIYILGTTVGPQEATYSFITQLLSGPYQKMKSYTEKEILSERDFILAQMDSLDHRQLAQMTFLKDLREKKHGAPKKGGSTSKKTGTGSNSYGSGSSRAYPGEWMPSGNLDSEGNSRLLKRAEKGVHQLYKHKHAWPFHEPVNPTTDGCIDYFQRIKRPMDLGTIKSNFAKGVYRMAVDVARDFRQVAANCREYNGDEHDFARWATELEQKFENVLRAGEEAELVAMKKRVASKKRKISDQLPPSGKGSGKKSAAKVSRKNSKSSSAEVSPSRDSSIRDDSSSSRKLCARSSSPDGCAKSQKPGSKYCSEECGMLVAKQRIAELSKAGYNIDEYIKASVTKVLVHSRG